jgi:hypothetical protein
MTDGHQRSGPSCRSGGTTRMASLVGVGHATVHRVKLKMAGEMAAAASSGSRHQSADCLLRRL